MRLRSPIAACALLASAATAQTPIRVDLELVNVAFSVRDSDGRLVTGLSRDDFDVTEDGAPRRFRSSRAAPMPPCILA